MQRSGSFIVLATGRRCRDHARPHRHARRCAAGVRRLQMVCAHPGRAHPCAGHGHADDGAARALRRDRGRVRPQFGAGRLHLGRSAAGGSDHGLTRRGNRRPYWRAASPYVRLPDRRRHRRAAQLRRRLLYPSRDCPHSRHDSARHPHQRAQDLRHLVLGAPAGRGQRRRLSGHGPRLHDRRAPQRHRALASAGRLAQRDLLLRRHRPRRGRLLGDHARRAERTSPAVERRPAAPGCCMSPRRPTSGWWR